MNGRFDIELIKRQVSLPIQSIDINIQLDNK